MIILGFKTKNHEQSNLRVTTVTCNSIGGTAIIHMNPNHNLGVLLITQKW